MSVKSGGEDELSITPLPPLPKLRLKPGLVVAQSSSSPLQPTHQEEEEEKTSRLLMKSECRSAGGRRKNGSSLVHSIPKFSEVKKGKLSEVQKVLQSRLLSKQRLKQEMLIREKMVEKAAAAAIREPPPKARRGRKPDKREITHVLKVNHPPTILPHLSEVTITPKVIYIPNPSLDSEEQALDLRTPGRVSPRIMEGSLKRKHPRAATTVGSSATSNPVGPCLSDFNPERTIRKFKFTPGEYPCLEEKKSPIRYILDPDKKSNVFMTGDFSASIPPSRLNLKMRHSTFHERK